jgi:hypothetical protein
MALVSINYRSRPSITSDRKNSSYDLHRNYLMTRSGVDIKKVLSSSYGYIMTEGTPNTISLESWLEKVHKDVITKRWLEEEEEEEEEEVHKDVITEEEKILYVILFQIIMACKTMQLAKIAHNDLHFENILLETKVESDKNCFIVNNGRNNVFYTLRTNQCIHIYDFDNGYNGGRTPYDNEYLKCKKFRDNSYTNDLLYYRDLVKVISYFFNNDNMDLNYLFPNFGKNVANILIDGVDNYEQLVNFYRTSGNFLYNPDTQTGRTKESEFKLFNRTFDQMLDLTYDLIDPEYKISISNICDSTPSYNIYYVFPETFDQEGMVLTDKLSNIKNYVVKNNCISLLSR